MNLLKQVFTGRFILALVAIFCMTRGFGWALAHSQNAWVPIGGLVALCVILWYLDFSRKYKS